MLYSFFVQNQLGVTPVISESFQGGQQVMQRVCSESEQHLTGNPGKFMLESPTQRGGQSVLVKCSE